MKYAIILTLFLTGCAQTQQLDRIVNTVDGSRIKALKITDDKLRERWHILDRKNKEDRRILNSMSWSDDE